MVDDGSEPPLRLPELAAGRTPGSVRPTPRAGASPTRSTPAPARRRRDHPAARRRHGRLPRAHRGDGPLAPRDRLPGHHRHEEVRRGAAAHPRRGPRGRGHLGEVFDLSHAAGQLHRGRRSPETDGLRASRNPYHVCTGPTCPAARDLPRRRRAGPGRDPGRRHRVRLPAGHAGVVFVPEHGGPGRASGAARPAPGPGAGRTGRRPATSRSASRSAATCARTGAGAGWSRTWRSCWTSPRRRVGGARRRCRAALDGKLSDVVVTLVAPWSRLRDGRRPVLDDPSFDLRMLREHLHPRRPDQAHRRGRARRPPPRRSATGDRWTCRCTGRRWSA